MIINLYVCGVLSNIIERPNVAEIHGDFMIGVLLSIREQSDHRDSSLECRGKIDSVGMERLEAALFALDMINNDKKILPGVTIGMEIRDTCWSDNLALRQSLHLIKGAPVASIWDADEIQDSMQSGRVIQELTIRNSSMIGVIGLSSVEQTLQVQNLIQLFNIPQIGHSDTLPELNDRSKYPTYLRVIPSDDAQSKVIRDILEKFDWTYVSIIRNNGISAKGISESLRSRLEAKSNSSRIYISKEVVIESHYDEQKLNTLIRELDDDKLVNVVIFFCDNGLLWRVYETVKRLNLIKRFTFIASECQTCRSHVPSDLIENGWGTISIHAVAPVLPAFPEYYKSLKPSENKRNSLFSEFWEDTFDCKLPEKASDIRNQNSEILTSKLCTGEQSLATKCRQGLDGGYVIKAVLAMAHGFHKMITKICGPNYFGPCAAMYPLNTSMLVDHLMNLSFILEDELVTITNGDSEPRYFIKNWQKLPNNEFHVIKVGNWSNGTLNWYGKWQGRDNKPVTSRCSLPCQIGYYKEFVSDRSPSCIWDCKPCGEYHYVSWNKEKCVECPLGQWPNLNRTGCDEIPIRGRQWSEPTIIMTISFTVTGLIATLVTIHIFIKYKNTPVVKASSRELSYVILCSMILAHLSVFIILAEPTTLFCALSRLSFGIAATMMFAGLFTKTNQIARILVRTEKKFPKKKYRFISTSVQIAITFICVAVETAICFVTMIINPSTPQMIYQPRDSPSLICPSSPIDVMPSVIPVLILHGLCILYAIKTRNVPGNFNEARFIGFSLLISSIIWIVFFTIFFETEFQTIPSCLCSTLQASVTLIFLFFPKLYIIIFKPEKNNRELFITNKHLRTHIGPRVNTNNAESTFDHPATMSTEETFAMSERGCRLRKTVAVQTSSKPVQNMISYSDDNESSCNDNDFQSEHDDANTLSKLTQDAIVTVSNNHQGRTNFSRNVFRSRTKFSSMMAVKSSSGRLNPPHRERATSLSAKSSTTAPKI